MFEKQCIAATFILIFFTGMIVACGCTIKAKNGESPKDTSETARRDEAVNTLETAMEQARQGGGAVHIDVDDSKHEDPAAVQQGDLAIIHYTASLDDGTVIRTTMKEVDEEKSRAKASWYKRPGRFSPEPVPAGGNATIPGLGRLALGMKSGMKKKVTLPPQQAFGEADPNNVTSFPCSKRIPREIDMGPQEFVGRFNRFPAKGSLLEDFNPYLQARIIDVTQDFARLEILARGEQEFHDPIGTTKIQVEEKEVVLTFMPKIGSPFEIEGKKGQIVYTDGSTFTVDFNPPFLGKSVVIDMEVVSFTKASDLETTTIPWIENHEEGLSMATSQNKPLVLVLYAGWCGYSKKLLTETLEDPRIKMFKDSFIWTKIDSDTQKEYKELYGQDGFPLTVIIDPYGNVLEKLDGYKDAATLYQVLSNHMGDKVG